MKTRNYYKHSATLAVRICAAVFMWSAYCLLLSQVLSGIRFSGGMQIFFLGIPLIVILVVGHRNRRIKSLVQSPQSVQTPEEGLAHVLFYLHLVLVKRDKR